MGIIKSNIAGPTTAEVNTLIGSARKKVAILRDVKAAGTAGGAPGATSTWTTRDLNTEYDPEGIVTLASNEFTLAAGTYYIAWTCPAVGTIGTRSRLYNVTGSTTVQYSSSANLNRTSSYPGEVWGTAVVTPTASTTYRIEQIVGYISGTSQEFGLAANMDSQDEIYTQVVIEKIA